jgi:hypothetical protein
MNNEKNMGVIEVNLEIFEFYPNNWRIKKISITSIIWVEENADFLKFISITPSYFSLFNEQEQLEEKFVAI